MNSGAGAGRAVSGGWLPTPLQETLLSAALETGPAAVEAWRSWLAQVDLEQDFVDLGSFRLLPLVWRNLSHRHPGLPEMGRLAGIYKRAWYQNQLQWRAVRPLLQQLAEVGIDVLLLKGLPLATAYYADMGTRPMSDVDVLLRPDQAEAGVAVLQAAGWRPVKFQGQVVPGWTEVLAGLGFRNAAGMEVDLHVRLLSTDFRDDLNEALWRRAVPWQHGGLHAVTLAGEFHLLHACVHGMYWNPVPPIRWVADAVMILRRQALDWQLLVDTAIAHDLHADIAGHLDYLRRRWAQPVPEWACAQLAAGPVGAVKARMLRTVQRAPRSPLDGVQRLLAVHRYYCLQKGIRNPWQRLWSFPRFVMLVRGIGSYARLLVWGMQKFATRSAQYLRRRGPRRT